MKRFIVIASIFCLLNVNTVYAKKLASLPEVLKPMRFKIDKGQFFISDEKVKFFIYSMKDFKSVKSIINRGEGPRECKAPPLFAIYTDCIFLSIFNKGMYFSRDGVYKEEFKTRLYFDNFLPVGKNFVGLLKGMNSKNKMCTRDIAIYTRADDLKRKKNFYYMEKICGSYTGGKQDYPLLVNSLDFIVYDNKIFVGDNFRGIFIEVFDSEGNEINRFKLDYEKQKIPEDFKNKFILYELGDIDTWKEFKKTCNPYFPEYFPAFLCFRIANGKIYIFTFKRIGANREVIITDLKGKILKRSSVPWTMHRFGFDLDVDNDKFYYIKENEDTEEWELHVEDIK